MAVGDVLARWDSRQDWSGESPADAAVLLQRFETLNEASGANRTLNDAANPDAVWTCRNYSAATADLSPGRWGNNLSLNRTAPATEQTSLTVPYFAGLWPASGKMLFKVWAALSFAQTYTPIISTRNDANRKPLVYLSTMSDGRPRAMIYNSAGTALLDQSESANLIPWTQAANTWVCYLWLVDLDAKTSQLAMVKRDTGQSFVGPVRSFTGTPNQACAADFEVATLSPTGAYWAGGWIDEVGYWQPATADMAAIVDAVVRSLPARGADSTAGAGLAVSDNQVAAAASATLQTGAQPATWAFRPAVHTTPALSAQPSALLSTDNGETWSEPTTPDSLPVTFDGLVRWNAAMFAAETLAAIELAEQAQPPSLDGGTLNMGQNAQATVALNGTWQGTPTFAALAPAGITVTFDGNTMTVTTKWDAGTLTIAVTVTDDTGLTSEAALWQVTISPPEWTPPGNPVFARAPLIIHDQDGQRAEVIHDPQSAVLVSEVNGDQTLTFRLPARHQKAAAIVVERQIEAAGELYRVRRITSQRVGKTPMIEVYCEARFYDLDKAGQIDTTDWAGSQAGTEIAQVLAGTGWTVGVVNVTTSRTWQMSEGSPLACLRQIAQIHGGDLTFDNHARTVSLLTFSGKTNGLTFFYGRGVADAKRVEDTTNLVTRITPRNADGLGIAEVNGGIPFLEDYSYTPEVKEAVYDFATGTNPYTMLAMATAALGKTARPNFSYEVDVIDLSAWSGQDLDRFTVGDQVTVVDDELGIDVASRIVRLEYDLVRPWNTGITLSSKLRELGSDNSADAAVLTTGTDIDTRDLVPFNLLQNARFDNGLAHWAASGATVAEGGVTGAQHVELAGGGVRWIEQTCAPDTRDVYTVSFQLATEGFPQGVAPLVEVIAEIVYDDGSSETVTQQVTG